MGVFKWLRRDRLSLSSRRSVNAEEDVPEGFVESVDSPHVGTIRTEEYKRSLAEFQARRLSGHNAFQTPDHRPPRKSARHSLPVSCTKCSEDVADVSFNYEKTSVRKYNKTKTRRSSNDEQVPNIQFLFSNQQVFMPGNIFTGSYSEMQMRRSPNSSERSSGSLAKQQVAFDVEDGSPESPPLYFKNNCLPFEIDDFISDTPSNDDSVSELKNQKYKIEKPVRDNDVVDKRMGSPEKSEEVRLEEVMDELRHFDEWADEQLKMQHSLCTNTSSDSRLDGSNDLPVVSSSALDISGVSPNSWEQGHWGLVPVHLKRLHSVSLHQVKRRQAVEVDILRKFRHPNIMLLMGIFCDPDGLVHLVCERCHATLYNIIHVQGSILSVQVSVSYATDISSALVFLQMRDYLHTDVNSHNVMITHRGVAKISDLHSCIKIANPRKKEAQYENLKDAIDHEREAQLSVGRPYCDYVVSETYRWHAPELFSADEAGLVHPCSKTDVYSLCVVLWECCNSAIPWKTLSYEKLSELYLQLKTGIRLPRDGSYPGCLLDLMQSGLELDRQTRTDMTTFAERLLVVKSKLDHMDEILIPAIRAKPPDFTFHNNSSCAYLASTSTLTVRETSHAYETPHVHETPPQYTSLRRSSRVSSHAALVHTTSESDKHEDNSSDEALYEVGKAVFASKEEPLKVRYKKLPEKEYSSHCSTPVLKKKAGLKEAIGTPGEKLHRSDSTEYFDLESPENINLDLLDARDTTENRHFGLPGTVATPNAKLACSFTPKKYKSLEIQIPSLEKIDVIKSMSSAKSQELPVYKFDIKDYSLPSTPIARHNKLRKNAWLSGEVVKTKSVELKIVEDGDRAEQLSVKSAPQIRSTEKYVDMDLAVQDKPFSTVESPESAEFVRYCNMKSDHQEPARYPFATSTLERHRSNSWSHQTSECLRTADDVIGAHVRPLVAIHERWISEAGKKTERLYASSDDNRRFVKPASHSLDPTRAFQPQLGKKNKTFRTNITVSPATSYSPGRKGSTSEKYAVARDKIARSISFPSKDPHPQEFNIGEKERRNSKCFSDIKPLSPATSVEQENRDAATERERTTAATNTSLDDFVKQLIKKEFYQLLEQTPEAGCEDEELIRRGTNNVISALTSDKNSNFSRVKISGNNKPLIQITFNKTGENSLQVLDSRVNVTISESHPAVHDAPRVSLDKAETDDARGSLKRCQTLNSLQEARSTEDLYIDDDFGAQTEADFADMRLIPLHGSLHEVLCDKEDDCCLIKVKQENGCDKIYFFNTDAVSRDAVDGIQHEKFIVKRRISFVEERIQRVYPKERKNEKAEKTTKDENKEITDAVVNLEQLVSYDDSSDESATEGVEEFEQIEKKVEEDLASNSAQNAAGHLEKISEENLSACDDDDKNSLDNGIYRAELRKTRSCEGLL